LIWQILVWFYNLREPGLVWHLYLLNVKGYRGCRLSLSSLSALYLQDLKLLSLCCAVVAINVTAVFTISGVGVYSIDDVEPMA
jgi:hypothetical protein